MCKRFSIQVKTFRDNGDANNAAEYGIAPWKLGQLAAARLMWDVMWGDVSYGFMNQPLVLEHHHVSRAFQLLDILEEIRLKFKVPGAVAQAEPLAADVAKSNGCDLDFDGIEPVKGAQI